MEYYGIGPEDRGTNIMTPVVKKRIRVQVNPFDIQPCVDINI